MSYFIYSELNSLDNFLKLEVIDLINFITVGISLGPTIIIVIIRMMEISIQPKENITGPYFDYLD
jgi:hypothetical protein